MRTAPMGRPTALPRLMPLSYGVRIAQRSEPTRELAWYELANDR